MLQFVARILDIILPRKDRVVRIDAYTLEDLRISPAEHTAQGARITTLMSYKTLAVADLIQALKYDRTGHAANLLAEALAEYLREEIAQMKLFSAKPVILVPVPLHKNRMRERGFNQIQEVLDRLPDEFKDGSLSKIVSNALVRTRDTAQQTRLSKRDRVTNVADAFALIKTEALKNANVILIDDVTTTGATLSAAGRPFSTNVTLLALAHA
jgi:ComF family protein